MKLSAPEKVALGVSAAGAIFCIGLWLFNFWQEPIAADSGKWAEFGDYLNGTLAPILAFASFIGLIVSIDHQASQREEEGCAQQGALPVRSGGHRADLDGAAAHHREPEATTHRVASCQGPTGYPIWRAVRL